MVVLCYCWSDQYWFATLQRHLLLSYGKVVNQGGSEYANCCSRASVAITSLVLAIDFIEEGITLRMDDVACSLNRGLESTVGIHHGGIQHTDCRTHMIHYK